MATKKPSAPTAPKTPVEQTRWLPALGDRASSDETTCAERPNGSDWAYEQAVTAMTKNNKLERQRDYKGHEAPKVVIGSGHAAPPIQPMNVAPPPKRDDAASSAKPPAKD